MRAGEAARTGDPLRPEAPTGAADRVQALAELAALTTGATLAHERTLPVDAELQHLLPGGSLRRGSNLAVHGVGATSFALALVAEAVRGGSFLVVVADRSFGLGACLDFDIPLRRVVQVDLGESPRRAEIVAALVDGFDVVLIADRQRTRAGDARRLIARARERGSLLVRVGGPPWVEAADLRFDVGAPRWSGLGPGHGHLRSRQLTVGVAGRRIGAARRHELLLPAAEGGVQAVSLPAVRRAEAELASVTALRPVESAVPVKVGEPGEPTAPAGRVGSSDAEVPPRHAGADIDAFLEAADAAAARESDGTVRGVGA